MEFVQFCNFKSCSSLLKVGPVLEMNRSLQDIRYFPKGIFPSGNFPYAQFPKRQLPKSVLDAALDLQPDLAAALGPIAHPSRTKSNF